MNLLRKYQKQIIISDPGDEQTHVYEAQTVKK